MKLTTSTLDFILPPKSDEESSKHDFAIRFGRFAFILACWLMTQLNILSLHGSLTDLWVRSLE